MRSDNIGAARISTGAQETEEPHCGTDSVDGLQMSCRTWFSALMSPFWI